MQCRFIKSIPQRQKPKDRSERWFEVVKLVVGFVLTGFLGTIITERYKQLDTEESQNIERRKEAREVLYRIVDKCNARQYTALQVWNSYSDWLGDDQKTSSWKSYLEVVRDWNLHRDADRGLLRYYFTPDIEDRYLNMIQDFYSVHQSLHEIKNLYETEQRYDESNEAVKDRIDKLDDEASNFMFAAQEELLGKKKNNQVKP